MESNNKQTGCNLDTEISEEDEKLLASVELSENELKLKETNFDAFWELVAEKTRNELKAELENNQEAGK